MFIKLSLLIELLNPTLPNGPGEPQRGSGPRLGRRNNETGLEIASISSFPFSSKLSLVTHIGGDWIKPPAKIDPLSDYLSISPPSEAMCCHREKKGGEGKKSLFPFFLSFRQSPKKKVGEIKLIDSTTLIFAYVAFLLPPSSEGGGMRTELRPKKKRETDEMRGKTFSFPLLLFLLSFSRPPERKERERVAWKAHGHTHSAPPPFFSPFSDIACLTMRIDEIFPSKPKKY